MSASFDDEKMVSMNLGAASGESSKGVCDGKVKDLKSETLMENSSDVGNSSEGVEGSEERKVLAGETSNEDVNNAYKQGGDEYSDKFRGDKRFTDVSSYYDNLGVMSLVKRVMGIMSGGVKKEVEEGSTSEDKSVMNLVVDTDTCQGLIGEPTFKNGNIFNKNAAEKFTDKVNIGCSGEGTSLEGKQVVMVRSELVPDGKLVIKEAKNAEADVLILKANEYHVSDLVWGKVRSHPWWPGQIFEPSAATDKARKHFREESYLIAYFGDRSFAWNEGSKIKPFRDCFSEMEKQSNAEGFFHAVNCALNEVSRRVEIGLSCPCLPKDVLAEIKTQVVINAGIREESSRRNGGDSLSTAISFMPGELLQFVESLAAGPNRETDRLSFTIAKAQLRGFNRWKGHYQLPVFEESGVLVENDGQSTVDRERSIPQGLMGGVFPASDGVNDEPTKRRKLAAQDGSSLKRKHPRVDEKYPGVKEKCLSAFMSPTNSYVQYDDKRTLKKIGRKKTILSGAEQEAGFSTPTNPKVERRKRPLLSKLTPRVGKRICTALRSTETLSSYGGGKSQKEMMISMQTLTPNQIISHLSSAARNPIQGHELTNPVVDMLREFRNSVCLEKSQRGILISMENLTADEILSKLSLAATNPMQGYDLLNPVVGLLSQFRNSVCLEKPNLQNQTKLDGDDKGKQPVNMEENAHSFGFEGTEDSYRTDRVIQSYPQPQMCFESEMFEEGAANLEKGVGAIKYLDAKKEKDGVNMAPETKDTSIPRSEMTEEFEPTALILNFTELKFIPSVAKLNDIFRRYGPLKESDTVIITKSNRAKVIFEKRADAQTAFSSPGKYAIFGPSLLRYSLCSASTLHKDRATPKQRKKKHP